MYEMARLLASAMGETYDALDRDRRDWWNELAEKAVNPLLDAEHQAGRDSILATMSRESSRA